MNRLTERQGKGKYTWTGAAAKDQHNAANVLLTIGMLEDIGITGDSVEALVVAANGGGPNLDELTPDTLETMQIIRDRFAWTTDGDTWAANHPESGKWYIGPHNGDGWEILADQGDAAVQIGCIGEPNDAAFVAYSRQDIPMLVELVEKLYRENLQLRAVFGIMAVAGKAGMDNGK